MDNFKSITLTNQFRGNDFIERASVESEANSGAIDAPEWIASGSTRSSVSQYAKHFAPATSRFLF